MWSWHPLLVLNLRRLSRPDRVGKTENPLMTVTRRIRSPGRARNKPLKPLRAGMPGDLGCTCGDYARVLCFKYCTRGYGCGGHPAFPTPSVFWGAWFWHSSGASRRGIADLRLSAIARSEVTEAIQLLLRFGEAGLLRGACHRARIRATRWLAMTFSDLAV